MQATVNPTSTDHAHEHGSISRMAVKVFIALCVLTCASLLTIHTLLANARANENWSRSYVCQYLSQKLPGCGLLYAPLVGKQMEVYRRVFRHTGQHLAVLVVDT